MITVVGLGVNAGDLTKQGEAAILAARENKKLIENRAKRIADWIEAHPGEIISLSIVELAEKCDCSEATIVRFSKRLGFNGYQGLKISLASESGNETLILTGDQDSFQLIDKKGIIFYKHIVAF